MSPSPDVARARPGAVLPVQADRHAQTAFGAHDPLILGLITSIISFKSLAGVSPALDCPCESGGLRVGTS